MKTNDISIAARLYMGFGLLTLLAAGMGGMAIFGMIKLADLTTQMYNHPLVVSNAVRDVKANISVMHGSMKDVALAADAAEIKKAADIIDAREREVFASFDTIFKRFLGDPRDVENARQAFSDWKSIRDKVIRLSLEGEKETAAEITSFQGALQVEFMNDQIRVMIDFSSRKAEAFFKEAQSERGRIVRGMAGLLALMLVVCVVTAVVIIRRITRPIYEIVGVVKDIADGRVDRKIEIRSNDEIGELSEAVNRMADNFAGFAGQAEVIASGDYGADIAPRSRGDMLGVAVRKMTLSLRDAAEKSRREDWLKTGQNLLNEKTRGAVSETELAENVITFLAEYLDALVGAVHVVEEENRGLRFLHGYAYDKPPDSPGRVELGEGLVGQAARDGKIFSVKNLPKDYTRIGSFTGDALPRHLLVAPFLFEDRLEGVIELGAFEDFSDVKEEMLRSALEGVAVSFNIVRANDRQRKLLKETQAQSEELQTQAEELQNQSEELEAQSEELRQSNEELINKTAQLEIRKKEIEHNAEEIAEKVKELELSGKYKSEFLANMSHEIRNPLNSMLILSQGLSKNKKGNLTESQVESARTIYKGGTELLELINDLLDLSRIEAGGVYVDFKITKTRDIAADITGGLKSTAEDKGLAWDVHIAGDAPDAIFTDKHRVAQILRNFVSNAVKFTGKGSVDVRFRNAPADADLSRSGLDPANAVMISVTDTGIGIPAEKRKIIFNAFQQADGSTSRKYGGAGLGLAISSELAVLLGGEIHLTSLEEADERPGGSTFTLCLPVKSDVRAPLERGMKDRPRTAATIPRQAAAPAPAPAAPAPVPADRGPAKERAADGLSTIRDDRDQVKEGDADVMLIIEDDPKFARKLRDQCHDRDLKALITPYGEDGLEMAGRFRPAGVILDIQLPDGDGWTVLEALKENPETRHIPVHIMSVSEKTIDAFERGAVGFLKKPAVREEINEAFAELARISNKKVKDLLVVEDDGPTRERVMEIMGSTDVKTTAADTGARALQMLKTGRFDCMILDLKLPDMSGFDLLAALEREKGIVTPPTIVYTGRSITPREHKTLLQYTGAIVIKGVQSEERLLDETALFLHRVVADMPPDAQEKIRRLYDGESLLKDRKILVVDDDMKSAFALSRVLRESGMETTIAYDGAMALSLLEKEPDVELVLMDMMMPVMDGYETMGKIRELKRFEKLPIIALTAKAMPEDRARCIDSGANDYITKPVDMDRLMAVLRIWLYR
ncbi:MAG: response regulator [Desulfobacterales bacterium]|nr:response regulator [Desulfobacterales bacterium]